MLRRSFTDPPVCLWTAVALILGMFSLPGCRLFEKEDSHVPAHPFFAAIRETVMDCVKEPARARSALAVIDRTELDILEAVDKTAAYQDELQQLHADYDAQRADFTALFDKIDKTNRDIHHKITKHHDDLIAVTKPEEWKAIMDKDDALFILYAEMD